MMFSEVVFVQITWLDCHVCAGYLKYFQLRLLSFPQERFLIVYIPKEMQNKIPKYQTQIVFYVNVTSADY